MTVEPSFTEAETAAMQRALEAALEGPAAPIRSWARRCWMRRDGSCTWGGIWVRALRTPRPTS